MLDFERVPKAITTVFMFLGLLDKFNVVVNNSILFGQIWKSNLISNLIQIDEDANKKFTEGLSSISGGPSFYAC